MKNTITLLFTLCFLLMGLSSTFAQTNVSGGIYSNTAWTAANSPYIVTDTVVVFPNVTLTIEPGVTIKFDDNTRLEVRQGTLIADGTVSDSIIFTSNSNSPAPGSWIDVFLNTISSASFKYCDFQYAYRAIHADALQSSAPITIKHTRLANNIHGVYCLDNFNVLVDSCEVIDNTTGLEIKNGNVYNSVISGNDLGFKSYDANADNCVATGNQRGFHFTSYSSIKNSTFDSNTEEAIYLEQNGNVVYNCDITNNGIGIENLYGENIVTKNVIEDNDVGVLFSYFTGYGINMTCNKICNTTYNVKYLETFGNNANIDSNYWCTADSAAIAAKIYDGYDNINLYLLDFTPIDTTNCYLSSGITCSAGFSLYPDPNTPQLWYAIPYVTGTVPFNYNWDWGDGNTSSNILLASHTYSSPGYYNICFSVTDGDGCVSTYCDSSTYINKTEGAIITVNVVSSIPTHVIEGNETERVVSVFPNPSIGVFNVFLDLPKEEEVNLKLFNHLGQEVVNQKTVVSSNGIITPLDASKLANGVYFLSVQGEDWISTKRVIKQ